MSRTAAEIARLVAQSIRNYPVPTSSIIGQLPGGQVAPAAAGSPGVVDLAAIPVLSTAMPQPLGTAAAGTVGDASDAGHVHAMPSASDVGAIAASLLTHAGDLIVRGASTAQRLAVGTEGQQLQTISGVPAWVTAPSFKVALSSATSAINTNTITKITTWTVVNDASGEYNTTNKWHKVKKAGTWLYSVNITWVPTTPNGTGLIQLLIYKNGSPATMIFVPPSIYPSAIANSFPGALDTFQLPLAVDDEIYVSVRQTITASLAVDGDAGYIKTNWSATWLAP
jgi:hypothetical protein